MQDFINRQFFNLTIFTLIFGVIFYDIINQLGFSYVDEICAVLILLLFGYKVARTKDWAFDKMFLIVLGIFLFYLIYSIAIKSNTMGGILFDFVVQIKPYIAFFCVYAMRPKLNENQKKMMKDITILFSIYIFLIGISSLFVNDIIDIVFEHPSRLATAASILALLYLYCSKYTLKDKLIFLMMLSIGLFSGRSKLFGFMALCTLMIFYFNNSIKIKMNFKNIFFILIALAATVYVSWGKIQLYFITGGFTGGRRVEDLYARMALYYFALQIFIDYIPFGSGFASYATYASGTNYSHIYAKYHMEHMHGLSEANPDFIADTYYPALAQFGIVGAILFFSFWIYLSRNAIRALKIGHIKESVIILMIVAFFLIECTSDSTITHNRGMFIMMLLGLVFSDIKNISGTENIQNKAIEQDGENIISQ